MGDGPLPNDVGMCLCGEEHEFPRRQPQPAGKYGRVTTAYDEYGGFLGYMVRDARHQENWYSSLATLPEEYHDELYSEGVRKAQLARKRQKRHREA